MKKNIITIVLLTVTLFSCNKNQKKELKSGSEVPPLTYKDGGLIYDNKTILLLSEIDQYKLDIENKEEYFSVQERDFTIYKKEFDKLEIRWDSSKKIIYLKTDSDKYETPRGIKVGSTVDEVKEKYGKLNNHYNPLEYEFASIDSSKTVLLSFSFDINDIVDEILITEYSRDYEQTKDGSFYNKNSNLTQDDFALIYDNKTLIFLSEISQYELNLDNPEQVNSYKIGRNNLIWNTKNIDELEIQWLEVNGYPEKILKLNTMSDKYETPRGIKVGSTIDEVKKKYGENKMFDNKISYEYSIYEATICLNLYFKNNKVERINIQSYD